MPRLAPWHRISAVYLSDEEVDDVRTVHSYHHEQDVSHEVSRNTKITGILVCTFVREQVVSILKGGEGLGIGHHTAFTSHWTHTGYH